MRAATLLLPLLYGCAALPADWSTTDRALAGAVVGCHVVDGLQTEDALDTGRYTESNRLLGDKPSDVELGLFKLVAVGGQLLIFDAVPAEVRPVVGVAFLIPCAAAVIGNHGLGARIEF